MIFLVFRCFNNAVRCEKITESVINNTFHNRTSVILHGYTLIHLDCMTNETFSSFSSSEVEKLMTMWQKEKGSVEDHIDTALHAACSTDRLRAYVLSPPKMMRLCSGIRGGCCLYIRLFSHSFGYHNIQSPRSQRKLVRFSFFLSFS